MMDRDEDKALSGAGLSSTEQIWNNIMAKRAAEPENHKHWTDRELLERIWEKVNAS